jgi:hypothetical protein
MVENDLARAVGGSDGGFSEKVSYGVSETRRWDVVTRAACGV